MTRARASAAAIKTRSSMRERDSTRTRSYFLAGLTQVAAGLPPSTGIGPPLRLPAKVGKSSLEVKSRGFPAGALLLFPLLLGLMAGASSYGRQDIRKRELKGVQETKGKDEQKSPNNKMQRVQNCFHPPPPTTLTTERN